MASDKKPKFTPPVPPPMIPPEPMDRGRRAPAGPRSRPGGGHDAAGRVAPDEAESPGQREVPADSDALEDMEKRGEDGQVFPIMALRETVVFPRAMVPLTVGRQRNLRLMEDAVSRDHLVAVFMQKDPNTEDPGQEDLHSIGALAAVIRTIRSESGQMHALIQGISRVRLIDITTLDPYPKGHIEPIHAEVKADVETEALAKTAVDQLESLIAFMPDVPPDVAQVARSLPSPSHLADFLASLVDVSAAEKQHLLEELDPKARLRRLIPVLERQLQVYAVGKQIRDEVKQSLDARQREAILREQLSAIQRELGDESPDERELAELRERVEKTPMSDEARKEAERELARLRRIPSQSPEHSMTRTYLEWLCDLPWGKSTPDQLDLGRARRILDEDHYGLEEIKERILEFLAIRSFKPDARTPILCFVGPPGTGKTSLGRSIARALGRSFARQSLGGVHDEAEIRGHRRTYVGAMPGKIIQALKRAGSNNPVLMLDEIDKLGRDFRGDPSSALLEVLDPEQNSTFVDHYINVPFDLSQVLFVCTANYLDPVPPPLRDRMEVIELAGYTEREKLEIARRYLIPKQMREHGLEETGVTVEDDAILTVIRLYTRDAGLRNLERRLAALLRKTAKEIGEGKNPPRRIDSARVRDLLGPPKFRDRDGHAIDAPGAALGLAWTPAGGEVLVVEAALMRGRSGLTLTGQLGDVMKESARAALSYVRSHAKQLGVDPDFFDRSEVHLHVPAGAIPKDGPSAGTAMYTALASLVTGRIMRPGVAMTGEITLRGRVLPVGGIKEKVLGAHRAGLKAVLIPEENLDDLEHVPDEVREKLEIVGIGHVDEILDLALLPPGERPSEAELKEGRSRDHMAARHCP